MDDVTPALGPEIGLFLVHCPRAFRPAWAWLWTFEKRINDGLARAGEPILKQMRIAWWRDRLAAATAGGEPQRDPMLQEFATLAKAHPPLPNAADGLLDIFEAQILAGPPESALAAAAQSADRFAWLAQSFAALSDDGGGDGEHTRMLGHAWGLAQASGGADVLQMALTELQVIDRRALPRALRLMHRHAMMRARQGDGQLRRRDGLALLVRSLTRII